MDAALAVIFCLAPRVIVATTSVPDVVRRDVELREALSLG